MRITRLTCMISVCMLAASMCVGQQAVKKMTNEDVTAMVSLGLTDEVIIDKIRAAGANRFDTSIEGMTALKQAKVSDAIIRAMINPHPPAANSAAPAVQSTPTNTNPDDPASPHDPGIYMYAQGKNGVHMSSSSLRFTRRAKAAACSSQP